MQQASLGIAALSTLPSGQDLIKQVLAAQTNPQNLGKALSGAAGQGKANTGNLVSALNQVGFLSRTNMPRNPAFMCKTFITNLCCLLWPRSVFRVPANRDGKCASEQAQSLRHTASVCGRCYMGVA